MPKKVPALNLPSADDLFTTQNERDDARRERVIDLPLSEISDFPNHPFKVKVDADMLEMAESVKQYGVLVPGLVRSKGGGYEMVAGHRRKKASELAECGTMPCIIRDLTDDESIIIMVDSNLQRERIMPSEKAFAYKMKLDAMKRQAGRPSENCAPVGLNFNGKRSREVLAENSPDSHSQIQRYIRLTDLIPPLINMVDDNQLAMRPAVELSYLSQDHQQALLDAIESEDCTPSHAQALKIRKFSEEGSLDSNVILSIMQEDRAKPEQFKMPRASIQRFFPTDTTAKTIEETIIKALELWHSNQH